MALVTENYEEKILEPFSIKNCSRCKGKRKLSGMKAGSGALYLFVSCEICNETLKVALQIKWIEEVR